MPLSDKNIIITPNVGQSADPTIAFTGANTANAYMINVRVYPTSSGTLSFEGGAGQLFSISNTLTGTIFSVNDISGIPSIEVIDSGVIRLAQYNGNVSIGSSNTVNASSNLIGALMVNGGIAATGNIYSGALYITGPTSNGITFADFSTLVTSNNITAAFIQANNAASFANGAFTSANNLAAVNTTQNTNISSAQSFANGAFTQANNAASFANGAFTQANNAASFANSAFTSANNLAAVNTTQNTNITSAQSFANSAFTVANSALANTGTSITANGLSVYTFANTTSASSVSTGAVVIRGGLGVAGTVYADIFRSTNNGAGTNYYVGDDAIIGDYNIANSMRISGQQDATQGYISFGTDAATNYIGRAGSEPIKVVGPFQVSTNSAVSSVSIEGYANRGGVGYHDFLRVTNTFATATTPNKFFRLNNSGGIEILNSAYSAIIMGLTDTGSLQVGTSTGDYIQFGDGTRQYTANSASGSSTDTVARNLAQNAFNQANNAFNVANVAYDQANSAASFANGAFVTANSAASFANGAFTSANNLAAVNTTQNTNITSAQSFANGAFTQANNAASFANGAFTQANNAASFANSAFTAANNSLAIDNTQNTNISSAQSYANGAFTQANNAASFANGAFTAANNSLAIDNTQNTNISSAQSFANSAFTQANNAASFANGAFTLANNTTGVDNTQNTNISSAQSFANSAFTQANNAASFANGAFARANSAYDYANTIAASSAQGAFDRANSAYGQANSAASFANGAFTQANNAASFANGAFTQANNAASFANSAFTKANNALANTTGTFAGDLTITGNLIINGTTTTVNTVNLLVEDNIVTLNSTVPTNVPAPTIDSGIEVNRGLYSNTQLVWSESSTAWRMSDGNTFASIASANLTQAAFAQANNAFNVANVAYVQANNAASFANGAFTQANNAASFANGAFTSANNLAAVNTTQNTNISSAQSFANSAFTQANNAASFANSAFNMANNSVITLTSNSQSQITTNGTIGNIVFGLASTGVVAGSYAYYTNFQVDAFGRLTTTTASTILEPMGNSAYAFANTGYTQANNAASFANGAFTAANIAFGRIQITANTGDLIANGVNTPVTGNILIGLATTAVAAGTYGGATQIPVITIDSKGRATYAANVAFSAGGSVTITDDNATSTTQYPLMARATSGTLSTAYTASTDLTFDPAAGTLSAVNFNSTSDASRKTNIRTIENPLSIISGINGVKFDWIENNLPSAGLIAQDVEKFLPELVTTNNNSKALNYNGIIGVLVEAIKEQQKEIDELKQMVKNLNK